MLKFIGGMLLIIGTSIGAGILALPVTTAQSGFIYSSVLLFFCWLIMTTAALMILEVNLWFPEDSNLISMAKHTLGWRGEITAWISYLLLLYSLLCAYIAGGSDLFATLSHGLSLNFPHWLNIIIFTCIFGSIIYTGIRVTDYVNRGLMVIKLSSFALLIILIISHVKTTYLSQGALHYLPLSVMVMITSFGFATIVPTLRSYFNSNIRQLRLMIILGSLVPLFCYLVWDLAILGTLPVAGQNGLVSVLQSGHITRNLMFSLQHVININIITQFSRIFTSVCVLTSFLGVSICLIDFLADGLKMGKQGSKSRWFVTALTFLPPIIVVFFFPRLFVSALAYAGILCVLLLVVLPILMVHRGIFRCSLQTQIKLFSKAWFLYGFMVLSVALLLFGVIQTIWPQWIARI